MTPAGRGASMKDALTIPGLVAGHDPEEGLVACEHLPGHDGDAVRLFRREASGALSVRDEPFEPFLWVEDEELGGSLPGGTVEPLAPGADLAACVRFAGWKALDRAARELRAKTGRAAADRDAPWFMITDPVQQYLMRSGKTLFKGCAFEDLRRCALDIETDTAEGFEFSNAEREEDRILAIGLWDGREEPETFLIEGDDEARLIRRAIAALAARDPDVVEGHNIFGFDLPYLRERARRHRVPLTLGREDRTPEFRPGRFTAGDRTQNYLRASLWGRAVADTYFLAQLYDLAQRALPGYGLKEVARTLGLSPDGRVYLEGGEIRRVFREDPERVRAYLADDLRESVALAGRLLPIYFAQAQVLPMTLQHAAVRGNASKIDALLLREALREGASIPRPDEPRAFEGGYTDLFMTGVARPVHHCDARSLYPSIMLAERLGPASDTSGVFLRLLDALRTFRLEAKDAMRRARGDADRARLDALQNTFKILINSFYGYLGFAQARYSDFAAAERVTARGREILRIMLDAIRSQGGEPVEVDTDGVYYIPPGGGRPGPEQDRFRAAVAAALPEGIEIEFDGEYEAMFSHRMKNYALRESGGNLIIKGAGLKSRGLEPYLRDYIREWLDCTLDGRAEEIPDLTRRYADAIRNRTWPIQRLARSERLQDAPARYAERVKGKGRGRNAAYELALASGRRYCAGDLVSYYVTGERKSVPVHANAKLVSEWNPDQRDENIAYYLARLDDLIERLGGEAGGTGDGEGEPSGQGKLF
jgi:DNA polymerase, archaea type